MNQQPDKLFQDKLANYQRTAPAHAWDKIDAGLNKTKSAGLWWKVAASLSAVAVAAYLLWPANSSTIESVIAKDNQATQQNTTNAQTPVKIKETVPVIREDENIQLQQKTASTKKAVNNKPLDVITKVTNEQDVSVIEPSANQTTTTETEESVEQQLATVTLPAEENETVAVHTSIEHKPVKLVFTVNDTEEYLDKKAIAQATDEEKDASTFKKLLKKAKDLKNNQDPFGDLREKKNEILALNFKNEKRGQNK